MSYTISALRTETLVSYGDHAQDVTKAVEIEPDETVTHLVERLLTRESYGYRAPGDVSPREVRYEDFIVLRIAEPAKPETESDGPF